MVFFRPSDALRNKSKDACREEKLHTAFRPENASIILIISELISLLEILLFLKKNIFPDVKNLLLFLLFPYIKGNFSRMYQTYG